MNTAARLHLPEDDQTELKVKLRTVRDHVAKPKPEAVKVTFAQCRECGRLWADCDDDFPGTATCPECGGEIRQGIDAKRHVRALAEREAE